MPPAFLRSVPVSFTGAHFLQQDAIFK